ncbi:MAG: hypothetical protein WAZ27_00990 [Minisyncoccia bacterium]
MSLSMFRSAIALTVLMAAMLLPFFSHAQLSLTGLERELDLALTPEYPAAGEDVVLALSSFGMDLARSSITWYVNGKPIAAGAGKTELSVKAGELGTELTVMAIAEENSGIVGSARANIRPTEVDLIWSADSYVPPFYEGRALPGTNATIHAQALARFKKANGTFIPDADIIYSWYQGSKRIVSGRGRSSATFAGPALFGAQELFVVAESADGIYRGRASARIQSVDPGLELYENHPLFGVLYHRAFVGSVLTLESEQLVTAVPYSAHVNFSRDASLLYEWQVNGARIEPDPKRVDTLSIAVNGYSGPAQIKSTLTSASDLFLRAQGSWELVFSESTSIFDSNPFGDPNR